MLQCCGGEEGEDGCERGKEGVGERKREGAGVRRGIKQKDREAKKKG